MAEGPGAQSQGTRGVAETPRSYCQILGWFSGAEDPLEALRESRQSASVYVVLVIGNENSTSLNTFKSIAVILLL